MDRVLLFVICEPLLQKQTTVLFPTINLNSEMQLSKIMINTTVKYMADPRQIWQCLYYEDSPPVSLPKARSQDRDLRHPSPRRTRSTGGETSQTTSIGSSIHCNCIALVQTQNICRNWLIFSYIGHRLGNLTQSNLSRPFQNILMIFVSNHPSHCIGHKKHEAAYLTPDLNHFDLKFDRL